MRIGGVKDHDWNKKEKSHLGNNPVYYYLWDLWDLLVRSNKERNKRLGSEYTDGDSDNNTHRQHIFHIQICRGVHKMRQKGGQPYIVVPLALGNCNNRYASDPDRTE